VDRRRSWQLRLEVAQMLGHGCAMVGDSLRRQLLVLIPCQARGYSCARISSKGRSV
jgi:hypothetical protein